MSILLYLIKTLQSNDKSEGIRYWVWLSSRIGLQLSSSVALRDPYASFTFGIYLRYYHCLPFIQKWFIIERPRILAWEIRDHKLLAASPDLFTQQRQLIPNGRSEEITDRVFFCVAGFTSQELSMTSARPRRTWTWKVPFNSSLAFQEISVKRRSQENCLLSLFGNIVDDRIIFVLTAHSSQQLCPRAASCVSTCGLIERSETLASEDDARRSIFRSTLKISAKGFAEILTASDVLTEIYHVTLH